MSRVRHAFDGLLKKRKVRSCLVEGSECREPAIKAHSVQNSAIIEQLVDESGHLFTLESHSKGPGLVLTKTGRNKASTFTGLCSHHDTTVFREIDFSRNSIPAEFSDRQRTLFFLRALLLEGWKKQSIVNSLHDIAKSIEARDLPKLSSLLQVPETELSEALSEPEVIAWSVQGNIKGLEEFRELARSIFGQLDRGKFHNTITHHWRPRARSEVATSSGFSPLEDLAGNRFYAPDLLPPRMTHLSLTVFPDGDFTNVLISHQRRDRNLLSSLLEQINEKFNRPDGWQQWLTEFMLEHSENILFRPSFVQSLGQPERDAIERAASWTSAQDRPPERDLPVRFFV